MRRAQRDQVQRAVADLVGARAGGVVRAERPVFQRRVGEQVAADEAAEAVADQNELRCGGFGFAAALRRAVGAGQQRAVVAEAGLDLRRGRDHLLAQPERAVAGHQQDGAHGVCIAREQQAVARVVAGGRFVPPACGGQRVAAHGSGWVAVQQRPHEVVAPVAARVGMGPDVGLELAAAGHAVQQHHQGRAVGGERERGGLGAQDGGLGERPARDLGERALFGGGTREQAGRHVGRPPLPLPGRDAERGRGQRARQEDPEPPTSVTRRRHASA